MSMTSKYWYHRMSFTVVKGQLITSRKRNQGAKFSGAGSSIARLGSPELNDTTFKP